MKKIFLLFIFTQSIVFSYDDIIGTVIFEDRNYFVHDKNEKKKEKQNNKGIEKKDKAEISKKDNITQKQIDKRNLLKKRGVNFLVWADRIEKNDKVMDTLLQFNSRELPNIRDYTIAASKDFTFVHSKTGLLYVSANSNKNKLIKYLNKKTTKKRISRNKVDKSNAKKYRYIPSVIKEKKVNLYKNNRTGFEYTLYK